MKRSRDSGDDLILFWHTREGRLSAVYPKSFLGKYSTFFEGYLRQTDSHFCEINLPYSREIVRNVFRHIDGHTVNLTNRQETMVNECVNFLGLLPPYNKVQNDGYEKFYCGFCSFEADSSVCLAKRWILVNGEQQCTMCFGDIRECDCEHRNEHCTDLDFIERFRKGIGDTS